jgi:hypothetical protein
MKTSYVVSKPRLSIILCFVFLVGTLGYSADTLQERVGKLWEEIEVASEPDNLSRHTNLVNSIYRLTNIDFASEPALRTQVLERVSTRLLSTLRALNANGFRREITGRSINVQSARTLFEAIVAVAPSCIGEFVPALEPVIIGNRDSRIAVAALSTLVGLSRQNPSFIPFLIESGRKDRIIEEAEQLEAKFKNSLENASAEANRIHFRKMIQQIDDALAFLRSDLKNDISAVATVHTNELEAIFREALSSPNIRNIEIVLGSLEKMQGLELSTIIELQRLESSPLSPIALRNRALQLVRREVHQRFSVILKDLPTNETDARALLQQSHIRGLKPKSSPNG